MLESLEDKRANPCFNVMCTHAINNNHIFTHIPRELKSHLCPIIKTMLLIVKSVLKYILCLKRPLFFYKVVTISTLY